MTASLRHVLRRETLAAGERALRRSLLGGVEELEGPRRVVSFGRPLLRQKPPTADESDRAALMHSEAYWRRLCPELSLAATAKTAVQFDKEGEQATRLRDGLIGDGYCVLDAGPSLPWHCDVQALGHCAARLEANGWPPAFLLLYDEPWSMAYQLSDLIESATAGNRQVMDWFVFRISSREKLWKPHRDRPMCSTSSSFKEGCLPKYNTIWIPLTDATASNSCLMVLPQSADAEYFGSGTDGQAVPFESLSAIRALTCQAGSVVSFSHRLLHWSSAPNPNYEGPPRVALTFACADPTFETSCFPLSHLPSPPFSLRLALVAASLFRYAHNENPMSLGWMGILHAAFRQQSQLFTPEFALGIDNVFRSCALAQSSHT